jgi:uroporphyrinogen decarboxylase
MLAACRCEEVDRPPVWLMRQAGRYLPEYRRLKQERDFWTLVRTPELASEVTLQPVRRFGMDAAIVFCDILVVPDAMGIDVSYGEGGPVLSPLVSSMADVERLRPVDASAAWPYLARALGLVRERLDDRALVGFAGAPFTLAAYMIEGRISPELAGIKSLAYNSPELLEALLARLATTVGDLLALQVGAGADLVQLFDTWAGRLAPDDYERWALPAVQAVVERVHELGVPVILYVNGAAGLIGPMAQSGCDVLSVDARVRLSDVRGTLGDSVALQGNLDPIRLLGPLDGIRSCTRALVDETGGRGHVVNLGHGVLPPTPVEAVEAFVQSVTGGGA